MGKWDELFGVGAGRSNRRLVELAPEGVRLGEKACDSVRLDAKS
jgi:hypothetical protein